MRVRFLKEDGSVSELPPGAPIVEALVYLDTAAGTGERLIDVSKRTNALIDTGADHTYIDSEYAKTLGLTAIGNALSRGATSSIQSTCYLGHVFFPEAGRQFETDIIDIPLRANGRHYDVIIGRLILERASLHLDYKNQDFRLEF